MALSVEPALSESPRPLAGTLPYGDRTFLSLPSGCPPGGSASIIPRPQLNENCGRTASLYNGLVKPTVQISLDLTGIDEAVRTAAMAVRAGIDWLEAGTPLIIAHGMHGVRELKARWPEVPVVADLKTMDGGWLEAEIMAKAGASMVVVMGQAHSETVELVVKAGRDFGVKVMGDNMAMPDPVDGARRLEELGCDYVIHHIGYDMRNVQRERGLHPPTPLDRLREIVEAVNVPVQAVGGLTIDQAIDTPRYGAPLVVVGAPLAIDASSFRTAGGDVEKVLRLICEKVHSFGDVPIGKERHS